MNLDLTDEQIAAYEATAEVGIQVTLQKLPEGLFYVAKTHNGLEEVVAKARSQPLAVALCLQEVADYIKKQVHDQKRAAYND